MEWYVLIVLRCFRSLGVLFGCVGLSGVILMKVDRGVFICFGLRIVW